MRSTLSKSEYTTIEGESFRKSTYTIIEGELDDATITSIQEFFKNSINERDVKIEGNKLTISNGNSCVMSIVFHNDKVEVFTSTYVPVMRDQLIQIEVRDHLRQSIGFDFYA